MDKFTLAPNAREIAVNRESDAGDDLFSYGPETRAQARSLGHLFVVGHTEHDGGTVGYVVSLIAAMAKREYFSSQHAGDAKDAFARMLRKVNEVVEEFFKANEVSVDVGIFAVAGDSLYVSRLGRFRILLARNKKVVDVLKDVSQFSKEVVQKERFSSIISGPIHAADRLLAYFPQLALTRREKSIKADLHTVSPEELSERLSTAGAKGKTFSASLLYIDIDQVPSEPAPESESVGEPDATPRLAWSPRQGRGTHHVTTDNPENEEPERDDERSGEVPSGSPNIIPAEFTHGSRTGSFKRAFRNARMVRVGSPGKLLVLGAIALAIFGGTYAFKSLLFTDEAAEGVRIALDAAARELKAIQTQVQDGAGSSARATVLGHLGDLEILLDENESEDAKELYASFVEVLDEIDRAEPAQVTLAATIDPSEGIVLRATAASGSDSVWVLASSPSGDGRVLVRIDHGAVASSTPLSFMADLMFPSPSSVVVADSIERILMVLGEPSGETVLPTPDRILSGDWFANSAYVLTTSGILKISDLDTLKPVTKQWLTDVAELAPDARHVVVDGDLWTLSKDGILTKYFKGNKEADADLGLVIGDNHKLLTAEDMPFLYISDPGLKRVHVVDKETMALIHTVTFDTEQDITDVYIGNDFSLYMLASDGKIWRVE